MSSVLVLVDEVRCWHGSISHHYLLACQSFIVEVSIHKKSPPLDVFFLGDQGNHRIRATVSLKVNLYLFLPLKWGSKFLKNLFATTWDEKLLRKIFFLKDKLYTLIKTDNFCIHYSVSREHGVVGDMRDVWPNARLRKNVSLIRTYHGFKGIVLFTS